MKMKREKMRREMREERDGKRQYITNPKLGPAGINLDLFHRSGVPSRSH